MKKLFNFLLFFLFFNNYCCSQDTIKYDKTILIFKDSLIIEKIFYKKERIDIKIIYFYIDGVLSKRVWYNSKGEVVSTVFDL
jgi:hypothetical protein